MKIKKLLATISVVSLTLSATIGYFPSFSDNNIPRINAKSISPSFIETKIPSINFVKTNSEGAEITADGWEYYEEDDEIVICGYSGTASKLVIPDEIEGKNIKAIADYAFSENRKITSIELSNVSKLGYGFLTGCVGIKEITIPKTVTEAWNALEDSNVETVTFEEDIANIPDYICCNASSVKSVIIPEKEDTLDGYVIGDGAFSGTSITEITIPDSITEIRNRAFENCALLKKISIPDNVTLIGEYCFSGCKRLTELSFGQSISKLGYGFLTGCVGIKEITLPKTVTEAWNALEDSSIETIIVESGLEIIPEYLATNCTTLKAIHLPDSVSEIGDYAFANCNNLYRINSNRKTFNFSAHSFEGCDNLDDTRFSILDSANTYLIANSDQAIVNGTVNYTLKYKLMPSVAKSANNYEIHLDIPEGLTLMIDTIQSKNLVLDTDGIENGVISVNSPEGELRFSVRITEVGDYQVYAALTFDYNNSWWEQPIGRLNVDCPDITCYSQEKTNSFDITVHGLANKGSEVEIYVDDKQVKKVTSNNYTGKYSTSITLPSKKSGESYSIYAKCNDISSDKQNIVYEENQPAIKSITLIYNGDKREDITKIFTEGVSPVFTLSSTYYQFEIEADHNDQISQIFVTSKKGNITKYLEAKWDAKKQLWITDGYFDPDNTNYIMGALNVKIIKAEEIKIDTNNQDDELYISDEIKNNSTINIIENNETETIYSVELSNGLDKLDLNVYSGISEEIYIDNRKVTANEIAENPMDYGFDNTAYIAEEDGVKYKYYTRIDGVREESNGQFKAAAFTNPKYSNYTLGSMSVLKVSDSSNSKKTAQVYNLGYDSLEVFVGGYDVLKPFDYLLQANDLKNAWSDYIRRIDNLDSKELKAKAAVIVWAKTVNTLAWNFIEIPVFNEIASYAIDKLLDTLELYLDDEIDEYYKRNGYPRSILDPSGYVYEAIDSNRIKDAKLTIYYKDPETDETVLWNAEDYDQKSTLYSESDGSYAWDVPEGLWKVVCEKDGYETIESEWLTVPPIQTGVNFALINKDAPEIISAEMNNGNIIVELSKYIDISSVTNKSIIIDRFEGEYTISPQLVNEKDKYTDTFIISGEFTNQIKSVTITDKIVSYAGTAAIKSTVSVKDSSSNLGDVNGDGKIDATDATLVLVNYSLLSTGEPIQLTEAQQKAADINEDSKIDASDATLILQYYSYLSTGGSLNFKAYMNH
ncbi:leucine-rich repeat protein [Ruminococcus sp. XPD3002]|uniref:leucine-rich repeat protein n=1 Tax=Ruminococcus sp. XPD3002 TaxID=1452269 RepID=UPI00091278D7|nr:Dockerin type I repeat-containing protein [Ruminococcus flavefaciens]